MPKPKFTPWENEKRDLIYSTRIKSGYRSAEAFASKLTETGLKMEKDSYLRRERGETPITADEAWYYAYVLGITPMEALILYSRQPKDDGVLRYSKDAVKHSENIEEQLKRAKEENAQLKSALERLQNASVVF